MYHQPPPTTIFNPVILPPKAAKPIREIPQLPPASNLIKAIAKKLPGASLQLQPQQSLMNSEHRRFKQVKNTGFHDHKVGPGHPPFGP